MKIICFEMRNFKLQIKTIYQFDNDTHADNIKVLNIFNLFICKRFD